MAGWSAGPAVVEHRGSAIPDRLRGAGFARARVRGGARAARLLVGNRALPGLPHTTLKSLRGLTQGRATPAALGPETPLQILFTSGTTGDAQGGRPHPRQSAGEPRAHRAGDREVPQVRALDIPAADRPYLAAFAHFRAVHGAVSRAGIGSDGALRKPARRGARPARARADPWARGGRHVRRAAPGLEQWPGHPRGRKLRAGAAGGHHDPGPPGDRPADRRAGAVRGDPEG